MADLTLETTLKETESLKKYRRDLHLIPELDFNIPQTSAYVRSHLESLPGKLYEPAPSSFVIYFDAGRPDTIAFRADMDGLPITERADRPGRSTHDGKMHACGHDGHMSMALALCDFVSQNIDSLPHNVAVIFQPAEESIGGAKGICESGIFQELGIIAVFGLHMWPGFAAGEIVSRPLELMARCSEVHIKITGKSVHIAKAWLGADALLAGANLVSRLNATVPNDPLQLLRFGQMHAGTTGNIVAGSGKVDGVLRSFSEEHFNGLVKLLNDTAADVARETGCEIAVEMTEGYPAVMNDPDLFQTVLDMGNKITILDVPPMTGEDFSFYQKEVPGVFFFVGTGQDDALHSQTFDFDEAALGSGLALLKRLLFLPAKTA